MHAGAVGFLPHGLQSYLREGRPCPSSEERLRAASTEIAAMLSFVRPPAASHGGNVVVTN
jgi:hypothetical protein